MAVSRTLLIDKYRDDLTTNNYNTVQPETQKRYGNIVTRLLFNILRSLSPTWISPVHYPPLADAQKTIFNSLRTELDGTNLDAIDQAFHAACYTLYAHERCQYPIKEAFHSPVMIFLMLHSVRSDGSFRLASQITGICAALEYSIRATMLVKLQSVSDAQNISVFEYV